MSAGAIAVHSLLALSAAAVWAGCLGVVAMRNEYERLHFMAPMSTVSVGAILAAVVVQEGWGQSAVNMSLILVALVFTNAVLAHATARAARVRELGQWQPAEGEKVEGMERISGARQKRK